MEDVIGILDSNDWASLFDIFVAMDVLHLPSIYYAYSFIFFDSNWVPLDLGGRGVGGSNNPYGTASSTNTLAYSFSYDQFFLEDSSIPKQYICIMFDNFAMGEIEGEWDLPSWSY